jgi:hypothetical protein
MMILILFHTLRFRCLKHFYLEAVCKHMCHLFPHAISYNRFLELEHDVIVPLVLFIKKASLANARASVS